MVKPDERMKELAAVALFADCSPRELGVISRLADHVRLPAGSVLMREDSFGHECFVLAEGEAVVTMNATPIARLGPGQIVGEMAVIETERRVATVTASTDIRAFVLSTVAFATVLDNCPSVGRKVLETVAHRLRTYQAA